MPRILPTADQALIAAVQFAVESLGLPPKGLASGEVSERTVYRIAAGEASGVQANHWFAVLRALPPDIQANVLSSLMPGHRIYAPFVPAGETATVGDRIGQTRAETAELVQAAAVELAQVTDALADNLMTDAEQQQVAHLAAKVASHAQRLTEQTRELIQRRKPARR
jgi:hypothetical protein